MVRRRSPRFPSAALDRALIWSRQAYDRFAERVVSRSDFAGSLGHVSVSGPAATKLATLRAYGLIEPVDDGLRVTQDAIVVLHSDDADARRASLRRLARLPGLFDELLPFAADADRIRQYLIKLGFPSFAAAQATSVFIDTCRFVDADVVGAAADGCASRLEEAHPGGVDGDGPI